MEHFCSWELIISGASQPFAEVIVFEVEVPCPLWDPQPAGGQQTSTLEVVESLGAFGVRFSLLCHDRPTQL